VHACDAQGGTARIGAKRGSPDTVAVRLEVGRAPFLARFEMRALAPFVPRVHEDERLLYPGVLLALDDPAQPALVAVRFGSVQHQRSGRVTGGVVPTGCDRGESAPRHRGLFQHCARYLAVVVDRVGELRSARQRLEAGPVRLELDGRVESHGSRVFSFVGEALDPAEEKFSDPGFGGGASPQVGGPYRIRQMRSAIHEEYRFAVDSQVTRIPERREEPVDVREVVFFGVRLLDEDLAAPAVPVPTPVLVRPAEAEFHVGLALHEHVIDRPSQKPATPEPVVVVAEGVYSVGLRELGLRVARRRQPQVVEAEVRREMRLLVTREDRFRSGHVVHSVKPGPHQRSFSGIGWNCGR
jgi:hypothetical protein